MTCCPHPLKSIFDPSWSPCCDCELLALRDQGVALERIGIALMRDPKAVEQRWHQLRVVPGIREGLCKFGMTSAEYPVAKIADLRQVSEVLAP